MLPGPRYRVQDNTIWADASVTIARTNMSPSTLVVNHGFKGTFREMWDVVTPDFVKLKNKGRIVSNPMTKFRTTNDVTYGDIRGYYKNTTGLPTGAYTQTNHSHAIIEGLNRNWPAVMSSAGESSINDACVEAITESLARNNSPHMQGAVGLAEMHKTLQMMKDPLANARRLAERYSQGVHKHTEMKWRKLSPKQREQVKASRNNDLSGPGLGFWEDCTAFAASEWLRFRYGFRPLMKDIADLGKALLNPRRERETARASYSGTGNIVQTDSTFSIWLAGNNAISETIIVSMRDVKTESWTVRASVLSEFDMNVHSEYGLGVTDTPARAWELMPYSFVVDWFTNVGSFISSVVPQPGVQQLDRSLVVTRRTTHQRFTFGASLGIGNPNYWGVQHNSSCTDYTALESTQRKHFYETDVGLVWTPNLSKVRILDAVALVTRPLLNLRSAGLRI